jgi:hypothetical protein
LYVFMVAIGSRIRNLRKSGYQYGKKPETSYFCSPLKTILYRCREF